MQLRTFIFWPHLVAGVTAGVVVLIMSITGVLLTYERQMIAWADSHVRSTPPAPAARRLPIESLIHAFQRTHPGVTPTSVTLSADPGAPAAFAVPQGTLYVDAYSGARLGEGTQRMRRFMSELRAWHRWLAADGEGRPAARAITGWSNVLFLFIIVTGAVLWLPRVWTWKQIRAVAWFRGGLRGRACDFNWHNAIGLWCAIPLFIVVVSAVPISFPWGIALVYRAVGEEPPAARGGGREGGAGRGAPAGSPARRPQAAAALARSGQGEPPRPADERAASHVAIEGLNRLWARAERQQPGWSTINLRFPESDRAPVVFAIDRGHGGQPHLRSTLTLDRRSGEVLSYEASATSHSVAVSAT
jgi:uncharacterized iron-regulated membrane protein